MDNKLKAATGGSKTEPGKATAGGKRPGENTLGQVSKFSRFRGTGMSGINNKSGAVHVCWPA